MVSSCVMIIECLHGLIVSGVSTTSDKLWQLEPSSRLPSTFRYESWLIPKSLMNISSVSEAALDEIEAKREKKVTYDKNVMFRHDINQILAFILPSYGYSF